MEGGGAAAAAAAAVSTEKQAETASYTYWVREVTQDAAPLPVPKKLTPDDLSKQSNHTSTHLGSAWNRVPLFSFARASFFFWFVILISWCSEYFLSENRIKIFF